MTPSDRLLLLSLLSAAAAPTALAYLDPASGGLLLQLILGGVAGVAVAAKLYWRRVLGFFGRGNDSGESEG